MMHRLDFALLLLTVVLLPLLYISLWFGIAVAVAAYVLVARLAGSDLDRLSRRRKKALHDLQKR
jgi:Flp pilus assembly protein TadB